MKTTKGEGNIIAALNKWDIGQFLPIKEGAKIYYGGYQEWLTELGIRKFFADRACGVTAASNLLCYLSMRYPELSVLFSQKSMEKSDFNSFQREIYDYFTPLIFGVPTIGKLIKVIEKYSRKKGKALKGVRPPTVWSVDNVKDYIITGLMNDSPVLILTWKSQTPQLAMHWVTITCLFEDGKDTMMVTSNWGEKRTYDFNKWVNAPNFYKGVVYFMMEEE